MADAMSPAERVLRSQIAAHTRWSKLPPEERKRATATARAAADARFEREVDPAHELDPAVRARLAENARTAHYKRMALKSAQARRRGTVADDAESTGPEAA